MKRAALVLATSVALFICAVGNAGAATRKYVSLPSNGSVVNSGNGSSKSGGTLSVPGSDIEGEYIPSSYGGGSKGTKLPVKPKYDYSIPRTIKGMTTSLKGGGLLGIGLGIGLQYMLDQVDGFIDENGYPAKPGDKSIDGNPIKAEYSKDPSQVCSLPASETIGGYFVYTYQGVQWSVTVLQHKSSLPSGYQLSNNCTNESLGYKWQLNADSSWPVAVKRQITSPSEIVSGGPVPLTESDYSIMEAAAAAKDSEWLKDRLRDHCEGGLSPESCYESLRDSVSLSGPSSITENGPTSTTVGPAGTTTTTNKTDIKITYGDNYYDYSKSSTVVKTNPDGTTETTTETEPEETTEEESEQMPEVTDLYKPYIDKLKTIETDVAKAPGVTAPIGYSAWYSFGGGCSEIHAELPVIGSWSTNYCPLINDWVRPVLAFIFVMFTWHYCRSLWSEAVTQGRPM